MWSLVPQQPVRTFDKLCFPIDSLPRFWTPNAFKYNGLIPNYPSYLFTTNYRDIWVYWSLWTSVTIPKLLCKSYLWKKYGWPTIKELQRVVFNYSSSSLLKVTSFIPLSTKEIVSWDLLLSFILIFLMLGQFQWIKLLKVKLTARLKSATTRQLKTLL